MRATVIGLSLGLALAAAAAAAEDGGLAEVSDIAPDTVPEIAADTALALAVAAVEACRVDGYQVAVVVVDRASATQVALRDRFAGPHILPMATRKARTADSVRAATLERDARIAAGAPAQGVRDVQGALFSGGGLPVTAAGDIVGGVGVSGAPDPAVDQDCAAAGVDAVLDALEF